MFALHKGYGGTDFSTKLRKRALCGLLISISAIPIVLVTGNWIMFGVHTVLSLVGMVVFGVWNPTRSARDEETLIAALSSLIPIFMV